MANLFDKMIEDIKKVNGGEEDETITALRAKRAELGEDASEEEIVAAIESCLREQLSGISSDGELVFSDEDRDYMKKATDAVKKFLDGNDWRYGVHELQENFVVFDFGFTTNGVQMQIRINVEANPNVCRIDAVLPISADATYEYPLCKVLAQENYSKRFGSFKYDERDGEVSFQYSFLARHGIFQDDLETYFDAVVGSVVTCYNNIRKCCVGRFKSKEVTEILKKVNDLVSDISE